MFVFFVFVLRALCFVLYSLLLFLLGRRWRRWRGHNSEDVISVWNKSASNTEGIEKIRESVKRILKIPPFVQVRARKITSLGCVLLPNPSFSSDFLSNV